MRKKGMAKVKKSYMVDLFIDLLVLEDEMRINGIYIGQHYSLSECLHSLKNVVYEKFGDDIFCIGIHYIQTRPDAYVNHSYINKTIYEDEVLNDWFYC